MMKCLACYKEVVKNEYCLPCRKKLFDGKRVSNILEIDKPQLGNIGRYNVITKRMSISGVQLKYSLKLENDELVFTETDGQYILKPIPLADNLEFMEDAPENEHLAMQIAAQVMHIHTAGNALIYFKDGTPAYLTKRFDIRKDGSKFLQEDFSQITNRTSETHGSSFKYDGTYEEIGILIRQNVPASLVALEQYFKILVFNYIISNGDAHLKNFSLIRDEKGEMMLSPSYDLMSTIIHTPDEQDTALQLFEKDYESAFYAGAGYYGRSEFEQLAKRLGLVELRYVKILDQTIQKKDQILEMVAHSFLSDQAKLLYIKNLTDRISRLA